MDYGKNWFSYCSKYCVYCRLLPQAVLGIFAGVIIDRFDRKKVIILADILVATSSLILAILFLLGYTNIIFVYIVLFLRAIGETFHKPALMNYSFTTEQPFEFVTGGTSFLNFNGEIPDFLHDIYDISPQPTYNSEYGSNIIIPSTPVANTTTYAPSNAPSAGYIQSPSNLITGNPVSSGESVQDTSYNDNYAYRVSETYNAYPDGLIL